MKKLKILLVALIILNLCAVSCGEASPAPTAAGLPPTASPQATPTPGPSPTPSPIPSPTPLPLPTPLPVPTVLPAQLGDGASLPVKTICLKVSQSGDAPDQAVADDLQQTFTRAGFTVADIGGACDATLDIQMDFTAVGAQYANATQSCFDYSSASMEGRAQFTVTGKEPLSFSLNNSIGLFDKIYGCNEPSPRDAPFKSTWGYPVNQVLIKIWGLPLLAYTAGIDPLWNDASMRLDEDKTPQTVTAIVYALLRRLNDPDPQARNDAATALAEFPQQATAILPGLLPLLADPDDGVRQAAAATLGQFGQEAAPAVPILVTMIKDENWETAENAIQTLGKIGPAAAVAVPDLVALIKNNDILLSQAAVEAVGGIGPAAAEAAPTLLAVLQSDDTSEQGAKLRVAAAKSMAQIGADLTPALAALANLATAENSDTQQNAVDLLASMSPNVPQAIPYLIGLIDVKRVDIIPNWEGEVINALGQFGPAAKDAIPALRTITTEEIDGGPDSNYPYALVALVKIGDMQSSEVSDQLIAILKAGYPKNHNLDIRIACLALAQLGPAASDAVVPALLDILKEQLADTSPGLPKKFDAWASILALGRIGEKAASAIPLLQSLVPLQAIKSPIYDSDGLYAVMALGDIGALAMPAVPDIILVLKAETNKDDAQIEVNALKEITEQDFGADAARWGSWWQAQTP